MFVCENGFIVISESIWFQRREKFKLKYNGSNMANNLIFNFCGIATNSCISWDILKPSVNADDEAFFVYACMCTVPYMVTTSSQQQQREQRNICLLLVSSLLKAFLCLFCHTYVEMMYDHSAFISCCLRSILTHVRANTEPPHPFVWRSLAVHIYILWAFL